MDNNSCIRQQADIKQVNRCKDRVSELSGSFDYLSNGLELAGNNVRLKILFLLYEEKQHFIGEWSSSWIEDKHTFDKFFQKYKVMSGGWYVTKDVGEV
ncbi:MAG: hypothetical protein Fur0028_09320 [Bacteroidales bacterium]